MALIDVVCGACGERAEVYRAAADWPATPPCPACGAATEQTHLPRALATAPPVIVFQAPDGSYRFPGEPDGESSRRYAAMGYQRREIRGVQEMDRFEREVSRREDSRAQRRNESRLAGQEAREAITRSNLRQMMQSMSRRGRDVARAAMAANDRKKSNTTAPTNFHAEVNHYDRGNREPSRDARGRRLRD